MISSPSNSPTVLVLCCQISSRHSKGFPERGPKRKVGEKIQRFSRSKRQYFVTVADMAKEVTSD